MSLKQTIAILAVAAGCTLHAGPAQKGKVLRATPTLGIFQVSLSAAETKVGERHAVRRNGRLIGFLRVIRVQGDTAFCKLDKTSSPGVPRAGDDVAFKAKPRPRPPLPTTPPPNTPPTIAKVEVANPRAEAAALFANTIEPLLAQRCYSCHGREKQKSKLNLRQRNARGNLRGLLQVVEPGKPGDSELIIRVTDPEDPMPPKGDRLKPAEVAALRQWISAGAPSPGEANSGTPANGVARVFYPDGGKKSSIQYRNRRKNGPAIHWHANGEKKSESIFIDGRPQGRSRYWYDTGQLQYEATFQRGIQHGPYRDWWPDGKPCSVEQYVNGRKHGTWRGWWPNGNMSEEAAWQMGTLISLREWDREGNIRPSRALQPPNDLDLLKPRAQPYAKRVPWTRGGGPYPIDRIYPGKPADTIEKVFGRPQVVRGDRWIYRDLEIKDIATGETLKNVTFVFKNGLVSDVQVK